MKKGFTLVEIMVVLAILLIGGSLMFGVFTSSYKLLNRERSLADLQDSFRNLALDMEKEINDTDVTEYKIQGIEINNINSYESIVPILLIKKGESNVLYFKGKKSINNSEILEKIVFDNSNINNNIIYSKESKTIIDKMNGNIVLSSLVNDLIELKCNFTVGNSNISREYSTTINLDKSEDKEVIEIAGDTTNIGGNTQIPTEPGIPDDPIPEAEVGSVAKAFATKATFIVLDQNPYNSRENLISIQPKTGTDNSGIDLSYINYYIQAISTDVMKKYINTSTNINRNIFEEEKIMTKAPALKSIYKSNGLSINKDGEINDIAPKNQTVTLKNNDQIVGCASQVGNECVILVNGDLNIRASSNDKKFVLGRMDNGNGQKILIYATGEINIDIENPDCELIINNCTLISANRINVKANKIRLVNESVSSTDKLTEFLKENLLTTTSTTN